MRAIQFLRTPRIFNKGISSLEFWWVRIWGSRIHSANRTPSSVACGAPAQFLTYFGDDDRPQARLDRDLEGGMGISIGRLREDAIFDYKFVGLSHNTLRGAAGGALLIAELLYREGYLGG